MASSNPETAGRRLDADLSDPSDDLLAMGPYAEKLAGYLWERLDRVPFTVGVFGEWGEGKTTFVRFLYHYLEGLSNDGVVFIPFSAWPYTTSDRLWRALIARIARVTYGLDAPGWPEEAVDGARTKEAEAPEAAVLPRENGGGKPALAPRSNGLRARLAAWVARFSRSSRAAVRKSAQVTVGPDSSGQPGEAADQPRPAVRQEETAEQGGGRDGRTLPAPGKATGADGAGQDSGLQTRLAAFLSATAVRFGEEEQPPPTPGQAKEKKYQDLLARLDEISYGGIGQRAPEPQFDQEMAAALVQAAVTGVGSISPLFALASRFLPLGTPATGKRQEEQKPSTPPADQRLERFQEEFKRLVEPSEGKTVFVFVDDLDRCQPNVALDIMESIRLALSEARCIFILAVDETLIAEGLRIRYPELFRREQANLLILPADEKAGDQGARIRYAELAGHEQSSRVPPRKGDDYLEKIIQLRVRVPPRSDEQIRQLVAGSFPQWAGAADIVQVAVAGNNPRRIKQYCQWLDYESAVGAPEVAAQFKERMLLHELIVVGQRKPEVLEALWKIADTQPGEYRPLLEAIGDGLATSAPELTWDASRSEALSKGTAEGLFKPIGESRELRARFKKGAPIDWTAQAPADVAVLAGFADVGGRAEGLHCADAAAQRMLNVTRNAKTADDLTGTANELIRQDLQTLIRVFREQPGLWKLLAVPAYVSSWREVLAYLGRFPGLWDFGPPQDPFSGAAEQIRPILRDWAGLFKQPATTDYFTIGELAQIPRALVSLAEEHPPLVETLPATPGAGEQKPPVVNGGQTPPGDGSPAAAPGNGEQTPPGNPAPAELPGKSEQTPPDGSPAPASNGGASPPTPSVPLERLADNWLAELEQEAADSLKTMRAGLHLGLNAARYLQNQRRLAKIYALVYRWQEFAELIMSDYLAFLEVQNRLNEPPQATGRPGEERIRQAVDRDQALRDFLELEPKLRPEDRDMLRRGRLSAPIVVQMASESGPSLVRRQSVEPLPVPSPTPRPPEEPASGAPPRGARTLFVGIEPAADKPTTYKVTLQGPDGKAREGKPRTLSYADLWQSMLAVIDYRPGTQFQAGSPEQAAQGRARTSLASFFQSAGPKATLRLPDAGQILLKALFDDEQLADYRTALVGQAATRVLLAFGHEQQDPNEATLAALPWEWLPMPDMNTVLAGARGISVVRCLAGPRSGSGLQMSSPLPRPLRVLGVFPLLDPAQPSPDAAAAAKALQEALQGSHASLELLAGECVTPEQLADTLSHAQWHMVHYQGPLTGFGDQPYTPDVLGQMIRQDGSPLFNAGIGALVVGNYQVTDETLAPAVRAAMTAVRQGVPAAIAPLRPVEAETAARFAQELYGGLDAGLTLEGALREARSHMAAQAGDWSAYCLVAEPALLDDWRLAVALK